MQHHQIQKEHINPTNCGGSNSGGQVITMGHENLKCFPHFELKLRY